MRAWLILSSIALISGCSGEGPNASTGSVESAVVDVSVQTGTSQLTTSARFVTTFTGDSSEDSLRFLGLQWVDLRPGECQFGTTQDAPVTSVQLQLRDTSPVSLDFGSSAIGLDPKAFPDVLGLASGVVFVGEGATPGDRFAIRTREELTNAFTIPAEYKVAVDLSGGAPVLTTPETIDGDRVLLDVFHDRVGFACCRLPPGAWVVPAALGDLRDPSTTAEIRTQRRTIWARANGNGNYDVRMERVRAIALSAAN